MDKFYENGMITDCKNLLQATPYVKKTRRNFDFNLTKTLFFENLYAERSKKPEFAAENDLFDNKIKQIIKDLYNKFGKVSLIHIAGYAGCGKTTYIHHLLWTLRDDIGIYDVIDFESCKRASEPIISRIARLLYKKYDIYALIEYFKKIASLSLYNVNRFRDQIPILKEFTERIERLVVDSKGLTENSYRILLEIFENDYIDKNCDGSDKRTKKRKFVSFLLFVEFVLLLFDRFRNTDDNSMFLVIDNADSLSNLSEESLLLEAIREFDNDCNYFFGWNLENDGLFYEKRVSDVLKQTKLSIIFTTRVATISKYESLEPDWETIDGWASVRFPTHYYDHKEIIDHRIEYYLGLEKSGSEISENLQLIKKLTEIAYHNYNFMRLFNGNYRICVDKICTIMSMVQKNQIRELLKLYSERGGNPDAIEGANGYFLSLVLSVFKDDNVYSEVLDLSPCRKDGIISLSRIILTILREKGDRCSLLDLLELLNPIGYNSIRVCTQVWKLSEVSRNHGWRRLLLFDVKVPSNLEDLKKQAANYEHGDRNVANYTELVICAAGQAYMEFVIPHFEFMLSRHELGVGTSTRSRYQPLFSVSSEEIISNVSDKVIYRFDKKIERVYKDVEDCCYNSVTFAEEVQKYFNLTRSEYISSTYYNYHPVGWDHDVGPKQSYESRLIFRHVGYIEKYRCYLLEKWRDFPLASRIDINSRLVGWIVKYLKLYKNSYKCYQTESQNTAANELLKFATIISESGFTDFQTRIERRD